MRINTKSPWFLVYVAVGTAMAVILMNWVLGEDQRWWYVILLSAAAVIGAMAGNKIKSRRDV